MGGPPSKPRAGGRTPAVLPAVARPSIDEVVVDPLRAFVFPNRVREQRQRCGYAKLMALASALPAIPYIRLSKIERGEVFARPDELVRIAQLLGVEPAALLLDVDAPGFSLAAWATPFVDGGAVDWEEERFAMLLAAALRARRHGDRGLTLARLDAEFGLPPVVLSRLENAQKPLGRWGAATLAGLCRVFGVADETALRETVLAQYRSGDLTPFLSGIASPEARLARTRERTAQIAAALNEAPSELPTQDAQRNVPDSPPAPSPSPEPAERRLLAVLGSALAGGRIAATPTPDQVEAPAAAGPRAFGLRVCRATLGSGLPAQATVVVDPDRYPQPGGLAVVREDDSYRIWAVTQDRDGVLRGHSVAPDAEIRIGDLDPADVGAVIAAYFV